MIEIELTEPRPRLSLRNLAIWLEGCRDSSREPMDAPPCLVEDPSDTPEAEGWIAPDAEGALFIGKATLWRRGLVPDKDVVRE